MTRALEDRAALFGDYGSRVNIALDAGASGEKQAMEWAGTPPDGYVEIKNKICWIAVYTIAFQSNAIDAARFGELQFTRSDQLLRQYFDGNAMDYYEAMLKQNLATFKFGLFWFVRRNQEYPEPFSTVAHVMVTFGQSTAAGSNNFICVPPAYWPLIFATHDISDHIKWDAKDEVWLNRQDERFDIVFTGIDIVTGELTRE
jgi:hypothetical protein